MITTVIIEDEKSALEALKIQLEEYCPEVQIVASAGDIQNGLKVIEKYQPELLFLDIILPDGEVFELLKKLNYHNYKIIFTTSFNSLAEKAFHYCALHYLLKPIDSEELIEAIRRVKKEIKLESDASKVNMLLEIMNIKDPDIKKIRIATGDAEHLVNIPNIIYCKSDSVYTSFKLKNIQKLLLCCIHLKHYEGILLHHGFMRVHQSYLINPLYISRVIKDNIIILDDIYEIPLGETYKKKFMDYINGISK